MDVVMWTVVAATSDAVLAPVLPMFLVGGVLGGVMGPVYTMFAASPTYRLRSAFGLWTTMPIVLVGAVVSLALAVDSLSA